MLGLPSPGDFSSIIGCLALLLAAGLALRRTRVAAALAVLAGSLALGVLHVGAGATAWGVIFWLMGTMMALCTLRFSGFLRKG